MNQHIQAEIQAVGSNLLSKFSDGQVVRIFLRATHTSPLKQVWASDGAVRMDGLDGQRVVGATEKRQRSVLIYDASKDSLLRGVEEREFMSCLCVPIFDDYKYLTGTLFVSSERVSMFSHEDRLELERVARDCSKLSVVESVTSKASPAESGSEGMRAFLLSTPVVLGAFLVAMFLLLAAIGPANITNTEPPAVERTELTPAEITFVFAEHLRVGEFASAWQMLDPATQAQIRQSEFVERFQNWSSQPSHQQSLLTRRLPVLTVEENRATATFLKPEGSDQESDWIWELTLRNGRWTVTSLRGPVISP